MSKAQAKIRKLHIENLSISASGVLGVDNVVNACLLILEAEQKVRKIIKGQDRWAMAMELPFVFAKYGNLQHLFRTALDELRDLTPEESLLVSNRVAQQYDIENDALELRIEKGINLLARGYILVEQNMAYYGEVNDYFTSFKEPTKIQPADPSAAAA